MVPLVPQHIAQVVLGALRHNAGRLLGARLQVCARVHRLRGAILYMRPLADTPAGLQSPGWAFHLDAFFRLACRCTPKFTASMWARREQDEALGEPVQKCSQPS